MNTPEQTPQLNALRQIVADDLEREPVLIPENGVELQLATSEWAGSVAALYESAYERGDYFASRYEDPLRQIFNPVWLFQEEFQNPDHLRFVFTDSKSRLLGATGFFHDRDTATGTPLMTSDATQIAPAGRGEHIMGRFFERVIPLIENSGSGIITDFVLTPESMSLRRSLQTKLGMVAIGIHPHALRHRRLGITRSEISAVKYPRLEPKPVNILPEFEPLYRIVQSQLHTLPEPNVLASGTTGKPAVLTESQEVVSTVNAADPEQQAEALQAGWLPVEFDPDSSLFKVARFPRTRPDLDFILTNEHVPVNQQLVRYLNRVLFSDHE